VAGPAIRLAGVRKRFDSLAVLQGVDLEVAAGETITIIGGSGSGKSVLLRLIIGLIKPDAGRIWIDGEETTPLPEARLLPIRRKVGMLFQGAALFDSLTVAENIAFPLREHTRMGEGEIRARVEEVLEWVGLPGIEEKEPAELSGGMKKRVGLARAIALEPRIILYDEPTTGLDPSNIEKITELIIALREKLGGTSVVVTHDMQSAFKVSDRIAMLHEGRIAVAGTVAEIEHSEERLVRDFIAGQMGAG
jgi:phospholipid/cholesterol/gamma-HCH transport system ATP-binding protein